MTKNLPKLFGIIPVAYRGKRTFYVKRSLKMENYPGVWSLPSIQFDPKDVPDTRDLRRVQPYMNRISKERLGGVGIEARELLTSGNSSDNPIGKDIHLFLYRVELVGEPHLNPDYYTDSGWLTAEGYERVSVGQPCGLCMRLWSDYAWLAGLADRPFVARPKVDAA